MDVRDHAVLTGLKVSLSAIAAGITAVFGGWDMLMTALVAMAVADYISGLVAAGISGSLDKQGWLAWHTKETIGVCGCGRSGYCRHCDGARRASASGGSLPVLCRQRGYIHR